MAIADTMDFDELVLEVEFDPVGNPDVFTRVCGMTDITVNRSKNVSTDEIPDCADESAPSHIKRITSSIDRTISGTGKWALASHQNMMDWFNNDTTLNVRVRNTKVEADGTSGDTSAETIPMKLLSLGNARTKNAVVSAEMELGQDGAISLATVA